MAHKSGKKNILEEFTPFTLLGDRYDAEGAPLDSLKELANYQRLLTALAEDIYLAENEKLKRIPQGFGIKTELRLSTIKDGGSRPVLILLESDISRYLRASKQEISRIFNNAIRGIYGEESRYSYSRNTKAALAEIGSDLIAGESLGFRAGAYTGTVREGFQRRLAEVKREQDAPVLGHVVALDYARRTFDVRLLNGKRVHGHYSDDAVANDLHTLMQRPGENSVVRLSCLLDRGIAGIEKILDVSDAKVFMSMKKPWHSRLLGMLSLPRGWHEDTGEPISTEIAELTETVLQKLDKDDLELPQIFPVPDGGIQLQYAEAASGRSLEVTLVPDEYEKYLESGEANNEDLALKTPGEVLDFLKRWHRA